MFLRYLRQYLLVFNDILVGGEKNIEFSTAELRNKRPSGCRGSLSTSFSNQCEDVSLLNSDFCDQHQGSRPAFCAFLCWDTGPTHLVWDFHYRRGPFVKLIDPVRKSSIQNNTFYHQARNRNNLTFLKQQTCHSRERYDDEIGPVEAFVLHEVGDKCDCLDGLS